MESGRTRKKLENEKVTLENEKVKLENEKVTLENEKVKLENEKVKGTDMREEKEVKNRKKCSRVRKTRNNGLS